MKRARLVILALGLAAAAAGAPEAQQAQKVVFALNWFAVGDHAAYWVALEKGYYKARGLDVELQNSKGSGDSLAKVDTNRADVGLADAAVVIPRIAQGARVLEQARALGGARYVLLLGSSRFWELDPATAATVCSMSASV